MNNTATVENKRLDFLQAFRGIAALMVTVLHIRIHQNNPPGNSLYDWFFAPGAAGVDLFFVISGFIMVYTTRDNDGSFHYFYSYIVKRISRIFPVYMILTLIYWVVMLLASDIVGSTFGYGLKDVVKSLLFYPLNVVSGEPPNLGAAVLYPGWTLNYEMYFYFVFGASLLFRKMRWFALIGWIIFTLIMLPLLKGGTPILDANLSYGWGSYLNLVTSPMIWEFAAGVVIGLLYFAKLEVRNKQHAVFLRALTLAFTAWWILGNVAWGNGLSKWGIPLVLLVLVFSITEKTFPMKIPKIIIWMGNISFSLYLVHPIIIGPTFNILWESGFRTSIRDASFVAPLLVISIAAAHISHKYLEVRLSNWVRDLALRGSQSHLFLKVKNSEKSN
jgi:peptidoglycan/LPS O-acetylase OafA/YrhL